MVVSHAFHGVEGGSVATHAAPDDHEVVIVALAGLGGNCSCCLTPGRPPVRDIGGPLDVS